MSALRVRDLFVVPVDGRSGAAPAARAAERAAPRAVGVLCGPSEAAVAGRAVALAAAARAGGGCAVVCRWTGRPPAAGAGTGAAVPPARRLAARLAGRGLVASARGRVVTVALAAAGAEARAEAERAAAAAGDAPVVLVVAGPRPPALDRLLAEQDRLIVVSADDAPIGLEALALADAARLGPDARALRLGPGARGRRLGWLIAPGTRTAVAAALDGHA